MTLNDSKEFLEQLRSELDMSIVSTGVDRDGFFIWIKNKDAECKRIIVGEKDFNKPYKEVIDEIKELIEAQKW